MSVSSSTSTISYTGNGSTVTPYTVPFNFYDITDLNVYLVSATGTSTLLNLTTNYTVTGGGGSTGTVTTTAAISSANKVLIQRSVPYTQLASFTTGDRLPANSIETALDKLTMEAQQLSRNALPDTAATSGSAPYVLGVSTSGGNPTWVSQTASAIADGSITAAKIAGGSITPDKLSDGAALWDSDSNLIAVGTITSHSGMESDNYVQASGSWPKLALNSTSTSSAKSSVQFKQNGTTKYHVGTDINSNNTNDFYIFDQTSNNTRLYISSGGSVGIGTGNTTSAKLDVAGTIAINNAGYAFLRLGNSDNNGWAISKESDNTFNIWEGGVQGTPVARRLQIQKGGIIDALGNPIQNCDTTAKAWVNFTGQATIYSGTYTQTGTTVTVSGNNYSSAGFVVGNKIIFNPTSGAGVLGTYTITAVTTTNMTFTSGTSQTSSGNYTLTAGLVRSSYNVSSITKNGTGDYTVNFATAMADANYSVSASGLPNASGYGYDTIIGYPINITTAKAKIATTYGSPATDPSIVSVQVFGN